MKRILMRVVLVLSAVAVAHADTEIDERRPFGADGEVEVEISSGSVRIEAWSEPEIQITGSIGGNRDFLEFEIDGNEATVRVRRPKGWRGAETDIIIRMPHVCREIRVNVTSADVDIRGIEGDIRVNAVSGDVEIIDVKGDVSAETVSGDLNVEGDIADSEVKSVSGDVAVKVVNGDVRGSTISGDLVLHGNVSELKCESLSGNLTYIGNVRADANVEMKAHSGNVNLSLPADVSAEFNVFCFSGNIVNELSDSRPQQPRGPASSLDMSLNGGSASIEAEAFSGNVHLKRL